jgi:hypothetical protein
MSALAWYYGQKEWTDEAECVCPTIRALCIRVNDWLPTDEDRERVIGPILFEPMGTRDPSLVDSRLRRITKFAIEQAAGAMDVAGVDGWGDKLRAVADATLDEQESEARAAARAAAYAAYCAVSYASYAAKAASYAADAAYYAYYANLTHAAYAAADAAATDSDGATDSEARAAEHHLVPLILELCAMGERREIPESRSLLDLPAGSIPREMLVRGGAS